MITISLCMIVKDEEAVLARVLGQMREAADEIIIVDTGSEDRTKEIARQYTDLVYDYPWNQDFAAARNFACSKASMDYWMWLDADDVVTPDQQEALLRLKRTLDPSTDVVMMKYLTGFDKDGHVTFSYYRERLMKNRRGFTWKGKVHESVAPSGNILYSLIEIEHRKVFAGDPDRNLRIYESMLANGETLEPRHQFYYGRELYYHRQYEDAIRVLERFLDDKDGWVENQIDACLQLSHCYRGLGKETECLMSLFRSFLFDVPRAEICCEIGRLMMERASYRQAIHWYEQALADTNAGNSGAFVQADCHGFIPAIQLCVCYDHIGDRHKALDYHKRSKAIRPDSDAVQHNERYFSRLAQAGGETGRPG